MNHSFSLVLANKTSVIVNMVIKEGGGGGHRSCSNTENTKQQINTIHPQGKIRARKGQGNTAVIHQYLIN